LAVSADGKNIYSAGTDGKVTVWSTFRVKGKEKPVHEFPLANLAPAESVEVDSAAFSPDGKSWALAMTSRTPVGPAGRQQNNNRYQVRLGDLSTGKERTPLHIRKMRAACVHFAPDGTTLAAAGWRGIYLWDLPTGRERVSLHGHERGVGALAFSPDGLTLVSGSLDGTVRLWEVNTGQELAALDWQIGSVWSVALAPDGMTAAAGGENGNIVIWDIER
jgi:WD40 repeat protein